MSMLLHRHLVGEGAKKAPEPKKEIVEKDKANDNKRKNNNGKNISKRFDLD